jgi:hypothetical protein
MWYDMLLRTVQNELGVMWSYGNTILCQDVYLADYRKKIVRRAMIDFQMDLL